MKVTPARWAALDILRAVRRGSLADRALARGRGRVSARDQDWLQEAVFGTLRLRGRLDHLLAQRVHRSLDRLEPDVLDMLRLGAYQILEMGSVPVYAAVSQAVEQAKSVGGRGAAGLVNGVLQRLAREQDALDFPDPEGDVTGYLTAWGSHPRWIVERWIARFGSVGARELVEANNRRPELFVRPIGLPVMDAQTRLARAGIESEPVPDIPDALRIAAPATAVQALAVIPAIVQDPAAGLVVRYAAPSADERFVDLCAAPGGKAFGLAEGAAYVVACDISFDRLMRVRENTERIDAGGGAPLQIGMVVADAREPPIRPVHGTLLDVPCTGTGTLRRHPDGKWRLEPADLTSLVAFQRELLDAAAGVVVPGGVLVYSTCSLEREENEDQVESFLARNPEYERAPAPPSVPPAYLDEDGQLVVRPHEWGVDGAFAARLRRSL